MALATLKNVRIAGIASAVPSNRVSNSDYAVVSEEQRQKVIKYTGIQYRRWAPQELCSSDLCQAAGDHLLGELGWTPDEIEALVFVTQTADYPFPSTAQILQDRMGLPRSCLAFDVNLGCSGYTYGLHILGSLLESAGCRKGLIMAGDVSKMHGDSDPASAVLFGHAGSATAMERSPGSKPIHFELGSDGAGFRTIYVPAGGARQPVGAAAFKKDALETGGSRGATDVVLDAADIMNFTLREVPVSIRKLLEGAAVSVPEIDAFVFHQANLFINNQVARKLRIKPEQAPTTLFDFGNTSSATVPLTITANLRERIAAGPARIVMSGFGVGLSWASVYWESDTGVVLPGLIEL
ncbi:MAG: ketoacyl-ACP synthase III [Opitutaceae bacterium]